MTRKLAQEDRQMTETTLSCKAQREEDALTVIVSASAQHRRQTAASLRRKLRRFETLYEMPSAQLDDAIEAGRLPETALVARWMVTWRAYQRLAQAGITARRG
jgi:hypothetical protein